MDTDSSAHNLKIEKRILNFSFAGSVLFLLAEIVFAVMTGSKAVLMDCIYDIADLIMIGPFLLLVPLLYKPVTEQRPYGYSQFESLFVMIKYLLLLIVDVILIYHCIDTILNGGNAVEATTIAGFEIGVSIGCILMYIFLYYQVKKYSSPSVKAELFIWKLDAMSTMGVGCAFVLCFIIEHTPLAFISPYVDPGIAIIVALVLAKEPVFSIIESFRSLMLFAPEQELFEKIDKICCERMSLVGCTVSFTDVIKTGRKIWVQVYFSKEGDMIDVGKLKSAHTDIKKELTEEFDDVGLEIIPDMEEGFRNVTPVAPPARRKDKIAYIEGVELKKANKKAKKQQV